MATTRDWETVDDDAYPGATRTQATSLVAGQDENDVPRWIVRKLACE